MIADIAEKSKHFFSKNAIFFTKMIAITAPCGYNGGKIMKRGAIMEDRFFVPLTTLVRDHDLEVIFAASNYTSIQLTVEDVSRPGIQLAGYFDHFEPLRLQVMGNVEMGYLLQMERNERLAVLDRLFSYQFPAMLLARNLEPDEDFVSIAKKHDVTLLRTPEATSTIISTIITYLRGALAPRITRHGVLMELYGEGVLLIGESGMGKSEAAVELLKRGHRLIADDAVEIRKVSNDRLIGTAPEVIRNYVELRGIGIINVARLFGVGAVRAEKQVNLVVKIVPWDNHASYDRMGMEVEYMDILGVKVPMNTIPITPGRNLAVILEVAAMNNRQRKMGYNAALEFTEQLNRAFEDKQ